MLCTLGNTLNIVAQPVASMIDDQGSTAFPIIGAFPNFQLPRSFILVKSSIQCRCRLPITVVFFVDVVNHSEFTAVVLPNMSRNIRLQNVVYKLHIDALPYSTPNKRPLTSLVIILIKYLDVFAHNYANFGTTNLTFNKIETTEIRPLCQPV